MTTLPIQLILGLLFCVLFVLLLLRVTHAPRAADLAGFDPDSIDLDIALDAEIQEAIAAGATIEAIKLYRELTGCGLREAKSAIDYVALHGEALRRAKRKREADSPFDAGVREMLRAGRRDDALRAYQAFTGADAADAEDEVARIEWEERTRRSMGGRGG